MSFKFILFLIVFFLIFVIGGYIINMTDVHGWQPQYPSGTGEEPPLKDGWPVLVGISICIMDIGLMLLSYNKFWRKSNERA